VCIVAVEDPCDYVSKNFFMEDNQKVLECFKKTTYSEDFMDAIITSFATAKLIYPYVDIARNPPDKYFKPVDYDEELEKLADNLKKSGGSAYDVFRLVPSFIALFHDPHFSMSFTPVESEDSLFFAIYFAFPFSWSSEVVGSSIRVTLVPTPLTQRFNSDLYDLLVSKRDSGEYAVTIDGKDAFEYLRDFDMEMNGQTSRQAKLCLSEMITSGSMISMTAFPLDESDFGSHSIVFSDGSEATFNFFIVNANNLLSERETPFNPLTIKEVGFDENYKPIDKEGMKRVLETPASPNRIRDNQLVICSASDNLNVISVSSFSVDEEQFLQELKGCVAAFDENDSPIAILFLGNGGGSDMLTQTMRKMLFPQYNNRLVKAVRKSDESDATEDVLGIFSKYINWTNTCKPVDSYKEFYKKTVTDDFGNGVTHNRTEKYYYEIMDKDMAYKYSLKKNLRKPTDVVVVTDGFCSSACSYFVNGVLEKGCAIVAGVGQANIGDERFSASQVPSNVLSPISQLFTDLKEIDEEFGISTAIAMTETYPNSPHLEEIIPLDYVQTRVDIHLLNYYPFQPDEVIEAAMSTLVQFETDCNPDNKRLFMYSDSCTSDEEGVSKMGFACGSDSHWNTTDCRIALCKDGYLVDFDTNKCVPNSCDNSGGSSSSSTGSSGSSADSSTVVIISHVVLLLSFLVLLL